MVNGQNFMCNIFVNLISQKYQSNKLNKKEFSYYLSIFEGMQMSRFGPPPCINWPGFKGTLYNILLWPAGLQYGNENELT